MPLAHVTGLRRHRNFKYRLRHVNRDRRIIHAGSSLHRHLWTQGDFGTSMPYKSRAESIPSLERPGMTASRPIERASAGRSAPSRYAAQAQAGALIC
jgi:hypothetical protein